MTTEHSMHLREAPFAKIKSGQKTLELRIYDEKRRRVRVGDVITFKHVDDSTNTIQARVTGLLIYARFADLLNDVPMDWLAYAETERAGLIARMSDYYPAAEEEQYGVVGIRIKTLAD
jgi:ASC-1-like (ASCH) protein